MTNKHLLYFSVTPQILFTQYEAHRLSLSVGDLVIAAVKLKDAYSLEGKL